MISGRIAVLICYDINFPELWHQAEALGADMLIWQVTWGCAVPAYVLYGLNIQTWYPSDPAGYDH